MKRFSRSEIVAQLKQKKQSREPIIVGGAGTGLVAKMEDQAGIDLIVAYNSGTFRINGHPSCMGLLAYGDSNALTQRLGQQLLPVVENTPVIAGVGTADPYRDIARLLDEFIASGFSGFTNFPTNGSYGGWFRARVDSAGVGFPTEVEMVRMCQKKDYFSIAYAYTEQEVADMIDAGADVVALHVGATSGGSVGWEGALSLDDACRRVEELYSVAIRENPDGIYLIHGGPFENPETVQYCFDRVPVDGFVGASSVERLPIEKAITGIVSGYKALKRR